jgi:hypothetical protein
MTIKVFLETDFSMIKGKGSDYQKYSCYTSPNIPSSTCNSLLKIGPPRILAQGI